MTQPKIPLKRPKEEHFLVAIIGIMVTGFTCLAFTNADSLYKLCCQFLPE